MVGKRNRFHGYNSLQQVYRHGQQVRSEDFQLRYLKNAKRPTYRVAVVVSKKVHKSAVKRNRIRRRVYEAVRDLSPLIIEPYDMVITVHHERVADTPHSELESSIRGLAQKAHIIAS